MNPAGLCGPPPPHPPPLLPLASRSEVNPVHDFRSRPLVKPCNRTPTRPWPALVARCFGDLHPCSLELFASLPSPESGAVLWVMI